MRNRNWAAYFSGKPTVGSRTELQNPAFQGFSDLLSAALLGVIALYRKWISPLLGPNCRFHPTCSSYASEAIVRFGPFRGTALSLGRLARCHPFCDGGYDPVSQVSAE
jgi:putative membrane protein insertion efficiency factor